MKTEPKAGSGSDPRRSRYGRVLLKVSGESFAPVEGFGLHFPTVAHIARQVASLHRIGVEVATVVGGGNILRGSEAEHAGMDRASADYMGMLATVINALALRDAIEKEDIPTRVQTAIWMQEIAEPFIRGRAIRHLEKGRVVVFAAGTGNPYFTTDTPAVLRALEVGAEAILISKRVGGIFDSDPETNPNAELLPELTYREVLERDLKVMDATAIALCKDYGLPIHVFDLLETGTIERVVGGERIGSVVH